jgi:sensor c-di-GMP phosphodiesterase-like protein
MRRSRIVIVAVLLAVIGAVAPVAGALYMSWRITVAAEQDRLAFFARHAIARADRSFAEARDALHAMAASDLTPCSPEHIARMQRLTLDSLAVGEIGYFENHRLKCTSWGMTEEFVTQKPGDYTTLDGIDVTVQVHPLISQSSPKIALHYKTYNVLVDPARFIDVMVDPGIQLAVANEHGTEIAELNMPDAALVRALISKPHNGMDATTLFATAQADGWIAAAMEPRDAMLANLRRQRLVLLPVGAFIAVFIVGIVAWFSHRRLSPLGELSLAVQNREFVVHYQPIVDLITGACVGGEALVRWRRPDGNLVRPDLFIPLAEDSGLIQPITDQVIATVIHDLGKLLQTDRALHVSINLGADDMRSGRVLPVLAKALEYTGILTRQIWLEMTERSFLEVEAARSTIRSAQELGYSVAIDDFGTGYSSLQYLEGLPLDALKIDKSFIETIGRGTVTSSVTPHIIDMAKALNLVIVAEGVETQAQCDYLRARGVDFGQGWLFARPMPADEFIAYCASAKAKKGSGQANGDVSTQPVTILSI